MTDIMNNNDTIEKLKVLYVGNDQQLISQLTLNENFELISKENGLLAINFLTNNQFKVFKENVNDFNSTECPSIDAILCDIYLSGMNAYHFFKELQDLGIYKFTPFILITNKFDTNIRLQTLKKGIDDYYSLPLNIENLKERISFLIDYKKDLKESKINITTLKIIPHKTKTLKWIFDIIMAGGALLCLSPLMIMVAIAIRLESKGKVYYISKRVGANYKTFDFYKFRSMYPDADKRLKELEHLNAYSQNDEVEDTCPECAKLKNGETCSPIMVSDFGEICQTLYYKKNNARKAFLKIVGDPRITKVGKIIRNTSIDELPQLINIIKGDMSIVGNRPLPLSEAEAITKQGWGKRFQADAGLTGLWQVELRGRGGFMSEEERFRLDNEYADHNSFLGDIKLIIRTFSIFIQKENV